MFFLDSNYDVHCLALFTQHSGIFCESFGRKKVDISLTLCIVYSLCIHLVFQILKIFKLFLGHSSWIEIMY